MSALRDESAADTILESDKPVFHARLEVMHQNILLVNLAAVYLRLRGAGDRTVRAIHVCKQGQGLRAILGNRANGVGGGLAPVRCCPRDEVHLVMVDVEDCRVTTSDGWRYI